MSHGPTQKRTTVVCKGCESEFESTRSDAKWCPSCRGTKRRLQFAAHETARLHKCIDCDALCGRKALRCIACANRSKGIATLGSLSPSWKGGRYLRKRDGYWEVNIDGVRLLEHRYLWEQAHGPLPRNWVVHHLNGIKEDNRIENLVGMARSHHGPRAHIDPAVYEARIRQLEARIRELEA